MTDERTVVVATTNPGKVRELARLLDGAGILLRPMDQVDPDAPEVVEDGATFLDNAWKKAVTAAVRTGLPALADDSGLEVDALGGAPGVHSARYAAPSDDASAPLPGPGWPADRGERDRRNLEKLLEALAALPPGAPRAARFRCVLVWAEPGAGADPNRPGEPVGPGIVIAEGSCEGTIAEAPRGTGGFGYDPVFLPVGEARTMAELSPEEKNARSHRAAAARALRAKLG